MPGESKSFFDVVSISVVEFIDKHRNENDPLTFSIKLFGKDGNDMKLYGIIRLLFIYVK